MRLETTTSEETELHPDPLTLPPWADRSSYPTLSQP